MKVVHITTSVSRNSACYRMHSALIKCNVNSNIICNEKQVNDDNVYEMEQKLIYKLKKKIVDFTFKIDLRLFYKNKSGMPFSTGYIGNNVEKNPLVLDADIVHVHWINNGMMNISDFQKLNKIGKKIVVTAHDNWFISGGCHVRMGCENYKNDCGNCPILGSKRKNDISYRIMKQKKRYLSNIIFNITGPSHWMVNNIQKSFLSEKSNIFLLPNPIDTNLYRRFNMRHSNNEIKILFGAVNAGAYYKGLNYLIEVIDKLSKEKLNFSLVIFGNVSNKLKNRLNSYSVEYVGYISNEQKMVELYNYVDFYVVPSLEDSFNQTVAESMACETPVVAFETGGIVDIIDHLENGYLAEYCNVDELQKGILWMINEDKSVIGKRARNKIVKNYTYDIIGEKLLKIYNE